MVNSFDACTPQYNSNTAHYMEGEAMRIEFETWFLRHKVDVVFAGHVHAYERSVSDLLTVNIIRSFTLCRA